jgi:hydroxymethylglutaryl-CoA reductase
MSLQAKALAISAGAKGEEINIVTDQLKQRKNMDSVTAKEILKHIQEQ